MNPYKYGFILRTFDATRVQWGADERTIEGYDGTHRTKLYLFATVEERDAELERVQVAYGEDAENGSDCTTEWVGSLSDVSESATRILFGEVAAK